MEPDLLLIDAYVSQFKYTTFRFWYDDFESNKSILLHLRDLICDRFSIPIEMVCQFAHNYRESLLFNRGELSLNGPDHLYFISDGTNIKIGRTIEPSVRIGSLQVSSAVKLNYIHIFYYRGNYEHKVHALFKHIRLKGEWFKDDGEIRNYITILKGKNPDLKHKAVFYGEI